MPASIHLRFALLAALTAPAAAQPSDPVAAIRADRWADAQREAAAYADPVAQKLIIYYRLLAPGGATADEITDFMAQSPDWPNQALLERRRQEAIAADPDLASTLAQCGSNKLTLPATLLHCAEALATAGRHAEAAEAARRAWAGGIGDEVEFLRRWSGAVGPEDNWERFQKLVRPDAAAAARLLPRLDAPHRLAAEARLALQRDATNAEVLLGSVPTALRREPGMMLDHARWLRRADRTTDALALWQRAGEAAQREAPADE